jgi:RNA polymerase sigma-70 factor (ECF subfamily)
MSNRSTEPDTEEAELARRIVAAAPGAAGDAEAALYRRLAPRVRLYGRKHLRDEQAAADFTQQVMLMTIQKLRAGELREAERIVSFVFGMCRMVSLDLRRAYARRERLLEQYADDVPIADAAIAPRLDQARLASCLDGLPERDRAVVVMTFYEERRADEVGAALGVSAGNVRVIRHRALQRLRDCVTAGGERP